MQKCPSCGFNNRPGVVFCENCGTSLLSGGSPLSTKALEGDEQKDVDPGDQPAPAAPAASTRAEIFPTGGTLRLEIEGSPEPIYLGLNHREIVLGRRDPATGALPDVDLTPFAGYRMGVSRRHSQIRHSEEGHLDVFDLGSSNGTFLNGRRLEAHYPYRLRDGDKLALGQIVIRVYFEKPAGEVEAAPEAPALKGTGTKPFGDEAPKPAEVKPPEAAQQPVQQSSKPADGAVKKPPEPAKPTTMAPGSVPSPQPPTAAKAEDKSPQAESPASSASEPPKTDPKPRQPEAAKSEAPKQPQPQTSASPSLGTASKPAEAKSEAEKPKQPQAQSSAPPTASKPAEVKPATEQPKKQSPFIMDDDAATSGTASAKPEAAKPEGTNSSSEKKTEASEEKKKEEKKEQPSKSDSPPKSE